MRGRLALVSFATVAVVALPACGTPPPGGGPVVCTGPTEILEAGTSTAYSVPKAISPNGQLLITTRAVGDAFEVTLRGPSPDDLGSVIATIPGVDIISFTISDAGEVYVYREDWYYTGPPIMRLDTATGDLLPVPEPDIDLPPGAESHGITPGYFLIGTPLGMGAEYALWQQGVLWPGSNQATGYYHVVEIATGEVVWSGETYNQHFSPSMTHMVETDPDTLEQDLINAATGERSSLAAARDALDAVGSGSGVAAVSDDGRYVVFHSGFRPMYLWDTVTEELRGPIEMNARRVQVSNSGRIQSVITRDNDAEDVQMWDPATNRVATIASGELIDPNHTLSLGWVRSLDLTTGVGTFRRLSSSTEMIAVNCA